MSSIAYRKQFRVLSVTLAVGVAIMGVKFFTYLITGSNAVLADALESIINVVAGSFALYSIYFAARPKDLDHPYGHGKMEFVSAGFEGGLITLAGLAIICKSIYNFFVSSHLGNLDYGLVLTVITGAINFFMGLILVKMGTNNRSAIMVADGRHLKSDAYTSVGLLLGLGIVYLTHVAWLDNVVAIMFGLFIIYTGIKTVREAYAGIMDEADLLLIDNLIAILNKHRSPNWIDIHNLRVIKYGPDYHIDCHVTLPWYFNLTEVHDEMEEIAATIKEHLGHEVEFFIHPDPCLPTSCKLCTKPDCTVRRQPFEYRVDWTPAIVMKNKKHGLDQSLPPSPTN
ncbi:MAG: cation diffusion facilitator family transporter [Chitinophagales bacterium]|nr:cation diffusion facilitator family transporter [Chitinophagales bacterium]